MCSAGRRRFGMRIPTRVARGGRLAAATLSILFTVLTVVGGLIAVPYVTRSSPVQDYSLRKLELAAHRILVLHDNAREPFARRGGRVAERASLS